MITQDNYYWYDGLQQVTRHDRGNLTPSGGPYTGIDPTTRQQQEDFTYDETGNWPGYQSSSPSLAQTRTHNMGNEITAITNPSSVVQPVYDPTGNMTTIPKPDAWTTAYTCKWDAWNRLVEVKQGSTVVATSAYDQLSRRTKKTAASVTTDVYYNKQWRAVEERVSSSVKAQYVWNPGDRWTLIRRKRSVSGTLDETLYCLRDYLDPVAVVDGWSVVQERYGYDAFGKARIMDPNFATIGSSSFAWNWLFHGEFQDAETLLYNYGYRYYHTSLGRWISRDPIGEIGDYNLYRAFKNTPIYTLDYISLTDPLCCIEAKQGWEMLGYSSFQDCHDEMSKWPLDKSSILGDALTLGGAMATAQAGRTFSAGGGGLSKAMGGPLALGSIVLAGGTKITNNIVDTGASDTCGRNYCTKTEPSCTRCTGSAWGVSIYRTECCSGGLGLVDDPGESWMWSDPDKSRDSIQL